VWVGVGSDVMDVTAARSDDALVGCTAGRW
jgi:hypothetical protein